MPGPVSARCFGFAEVVRVGLWAGLFLRFRGLPRGGGWGSIGGKVSEGAAWRRPERGAWNPTDMQIDLTGKVALVTGATGDLGRVMARTLAECGADVGINYHSNEAKAREIQSEIESLGRRAACFQADVTQRDAVFAMQQGVAAALGDADIVVCNAVIQYKWTSVLEQAPEDFESQFRSCTLHAAFMAQAFVPAMQAKGWGRFIAINTECAMQCHASQAAYASGKRGLDGLMRVLAREVGPQGITVNQVAPGWMISARDRESGTEKQPAYESRIPLRRRGEDRDIANAVAWLASDLAGYVSGVYLPVCGGDVMPTI